MGDFGPAVSYMLAGLPREDHFFASSSWLAEGSTMYVIRDLAQRCFNSNEGVWTVPEDQRIVPVRNEARDGTVTIVPTVVRSRIGHFGLSAHCTFSDFLIFLGELVKRRVGERLERLVLTHGTPEAIEASRSQLVQYVKDEKNIVPGYPGTIIDLDKVA